MHQLHWFLVDYSVKTCDVAVFLHEMMLSPAFLFLFSNQCLSRFCLLYYPACFASFHVSIMAASFDPCIFSDLTYCGSAHWGQRRTVLWLPVC